MYSRIKTALLETDKPSAFFESLQEEDRHTLHEVFDLIGVPQPRKYHPEGDAYVHTMMVVDEAAALRDRAQRPFDFMLSALTHDLGKKVTTKQDEDGEWHAIGHERKGLPLVRAMLTRIGAEEETICYCENLCKLHMRVHTCFYGKAGVKATDRLFGECVCPQDLSLLCICDSRGKGKAGASSLPEEQYIIERLHHYLRFAAQK